MDNDQIEKLLKEYDFNKNSKISFARKYNINIRTVNNYLNKFNIGINKIRLSVDRNRDNLGRFVRNKIVNSQNNIEIKKQKDEFSFSLNNFSDFNNSNEFIERLRKRNENKTDDPSELLKYFKSH